jgi:uncharacterized protein YggE
MKRTTVVAGVAAVTVLIALVALVYRQGQAVAFAQEAKGDVEKDDKHVITISGTGTIRIKPDSARLFFTVESYAEQVRVARTDNAARVQKLMKALADLKIDGLKSKSDNINVQQLVDRNDGRQLPRVIGYHVTNSFTVLVENEDRAKLGTDASRVLDTVLENGGTGVSQITFFKKGAEAEKLRRQAMTKAVEDALANGRAVLAGMNRNKLEPLTVSVTPRSYYPDNRQQNTLQGDFRGGGEDTSTALVAGDLEIRCDVSLTCRY